MSIAAVDGQCTRARPTLSASPSTPTSITAPSANSPDSTLRDRVHQPLLDHALQRAGAVNRVVAALAELVEGVGGHAAVGQPRPHR